MDPDDKKVKIDWFYPKRIVLSTIREDQFLYISLELDYRHSFCCYNVFLLILPPILSAFFIFYTTSLLSSPPSMCRSDRLCRSLSHQHLPEVFRSTSPPSMCRSDRCCWSLSHQHLPEVFRSSCKIENYCSSITSLLMRLES